MESHPEPLDQPLTLAGAETAAAPSAPASATDAATPVVSAFYDRFPYPGDPLQDGPPPGYNWRWCVDTVQAAVTGQRPVTAPGGFLTRAVAPGSAPITSAISTQGPVCWR